MSLIDFIDKYFSKWSITSISTCRKGRGSLMLRNKETFILVYFNMNDGKSWTDSCVTVDHVEAYEYG